MNRTASLVIASTLGLATIAPARAAIDPLILVPGQIITAARFTPAADAPVLPAFKGEDIPIDTGNAADSTCRVLGSVTASARMFDVLTPRPTHADVDVALRREAMRHGADRLADVRYVTRRQGLVAGGRINGTATALACKA